MSLYWRVISLGRPAPGPALAVASEDSVVGDWAAYLCFIPAGDWPTPCFWTGPADLGAKAVALLSPPAVEFCYAHGDKMDPDAAAALFPEIAARSRWRA